MQNALLTIFGIRSTPPDKTETHYRFGTIEGESFCSRFFVGTYPFVTWALKKESIERQLFWNSELDASLISTQMIYGVLPEAARWQDEEYYIRIRRAVIFILDWFKMSDETIDYDTAIALEKQRLGLIEAFSRGPTSKFSFENEIIARKEKFLESHKIVKTMYKRCDECNVEITSYVAYWKHVANSHPKEFVTATCPECDESFDCDAWRVHDHRPAQCRIPGCVAKPRNLASKDCHAATHSKTYSQCFGSNAEDQSGASNGKKSCDHDSNIYALGEDLIRVHLDQASIVSQFLGSAVAVLNRGTIPWKTSVQDVPNLGTRRIQYTGDSWNTANEHGYFGETLEKYEAKQLLSAFRRLVPDGYCIVMRRGTLFIDVNGEDQSDGLNLGMPGAPPMAGTMGSMGIAANVGAMGPMAIKAPPAIVDSMNTVAAAINMNTLGVDPDMVLMGGRSDDLKSLATSQKYLLSSTQVSTTTAANTRVGKIFYGMAAGRVAEWMRLHRRFSGTLRYEIQIVGNGSLTGSLAIGWYQGQTTDAPPAPSVGSAFYDVNWTVMAVNQSSSIVMELVDTRKDMFWRPLHYDWAPETGFSTGFGPGLGIFVKDPIQNPFGAESSVTLNLYVSAGPDFMCIEPNSAATRDTSPLQTSLSSILGPTGYLSLDNPYPSIVPGAISLWKVTADSVGPTQGFTGLLSGDAPAELTATTVPMVPQLIPFKFKEAWSSHVAENAGDRTGLYALSCTDSNVGAVIRIFGTGTATEQDVNKAPYCLAALNILRPGNAPGLDAMRWFNNNFNIYRENYPVMFTPIDSVTQNLTVAHSTVSPLGRGSMWFVGLAEQVNRVEWGDFCAQWCRYKAKIASPKLVLASENYDLQTVGLSPYCALLNATAGTPPGVARLAPKTVVATYPDAQTYALLDWFRGRSLSFNGSALSFNIREVRSERVVVSGVYDYDQGVCYTTVASNAVKHQLCTLKNFNELMITDITPTTSGSNPPPIPTDLWVPRVVDSNSADQAVRDLRTKLTHPVMGTCNPVYNDDDIDQVVVEVPKDDLADIDETIFAPGTDQANAAQNAMVRHQQLLQTRFFAHERGEKYSVARNGLLLDHKDRKENRKQAGQIHSDRHALNTTIADDTAALGHRRLDIESRTADRNFETAGRSADLGLKRLELDSRTADRNHEIASKNTALGQGRLDQDAHTADRNHEIASARIDLDTARLDADTAIRSSHAINETTATEGNLSNAGKRIDLDTRKHEAESLTAASKIDVDARKIDNEHALGKERIAAGTAIETEKLASAERMQKAEHSFKGGLHRAQSNKALGGTGSEWAPQSASGSMIAGGAAIGQGVGNIAGGVAGMYYAGKEFGLKEDDLALRKNMARDDMRMQQNDNATQINMQKVNNGMQRAQAMSQMSGVDGSYANSFQPGTMMTTNYESHV
jgi:hypothetical protein